MECFFTTLRALDSIDLLEIFSYVGGNVFQRLTKDGLSFKKSPINKIYYFDVL